MIVLCLRRITIMRNGATNQNSASILNVSALVVFLLEGINSSQHVVVCLGQAACLLLLMEILLNVQGGSCLSNKESLLDFDALLGLVQDVLVSFVGTICTSSSSTVLPSAAFKRYCV